MLGIHVPGQKIVLTSRSGNVLDNVDVPSPVERFLGRPTDSSFELLTDLEYHFGYGIDTHPTPTNVHPYVFQPVCFANLRNEPVLCIINPVYPKAQGLFTFRLFLRRFCARSLGGLGSHDGEICKSFYEAAWQYWLVPNQDEEAVVCLQDAIGLHRPQVISVSY
jgi:hypothetical protein